MENWKISIAQELQVTRSRQRRGLWACSAHGIPVPPLRASCVSAPQFYFLPDNKNSLISLLLRPQEDSTRSENILTRSLSESTRPESIRTLSRLTGLTSYQFVLTSACAVKYIALSSLRIATFFESQLQFSNPPGECVAVAGVSPAL